jgi:hypothetical protein
MKKYLVGFSVGIAIFAGPFLAHAATTYYLSPSGSDSNSGTSASSPWASPDHAVNCGDTISAAAGTYSASNFGNGRWGNVSCAAGNNVAMLKCATFDACKVTSTSGDAMWIDKSYWGVEGWEASTNTTSDGACFHVGPSSGSVNHVVLADDVANGCRGGGFNAYDSSKSASVDYIAYVGDIAYNTAGGSGACYSGFNVYQPIASDANAGTHMYVGGNFSYANTDGDPCAGTAPTDGEGINFDTWDFSQGGGTAYVQQGVITNNIEFANGGDGIEVENDSKSAPIYIYNNTMYGDRRDMQEGYCSGNGDLDLYQADNVTTHNNLIYTGFATNCGGDPFYAVTVSNGGSTDSVANTWFSGVSGNNTYTQSDGSFALGSGNTVGTNPSFANPVTPGAPACSGTASVPACMASVIADYTPTVTAAKAYGYQAPSGATDALFPAWLCNVGLPSGLVNENCGAGGGTTGGGGTTTPPADTTPPSTPTNLSASAVSTSQINLSWTASTDNVGVVGYNIYRGGTEIGTATTNSYQSTGLSASTNYSYTVSAYDAAGNTSAQSSAASAMTQAVVVTPPVTTSTPPVTTVKVPFRIEAGATNAYTDASGNLWSPDKYFTGGATFSNTSTISNTTAPSIYKTERYGVSSSSFAYNIPVANGSYTINLDFAETYLSGAGQRIFGASINGTTVLSNFDIYASAGGKNIAITKTFNVTVTNGTLNITFIPGSIQDPKVNGIEILPLSAGGTTTTGTSTTPVLSTTIGVGASVITLAKLNVRQTASLSGTLLGTEALGSVGTVASSSQSANGYTWWRVNYANGTAGWSVGNYLTPYITSSQPVGVNTPSVNASAASQLAAMEVELAQLEALYQSLIGH